MKRYLLLIIILLAGLPVFSQDYAAGLNALDRTKFKKAQNIFVKLASENLRTSRVAGYYGLGLLYSDPRFDGVDTTQAYKFFNIALKYLENSRLGVKDYVARTYGITAQGIKEKIASLLEPEFKAVLQSGNVDAMNDFIYKYSSSPQSEILQRYVDSLDFARAKEESTVYAYKKFMVDHPGSVYSDSAALYADNLLKDEFFRVYKTLDLNEIEDFEKKYPDFGLFRDSAMYYKDLAYQAMALKLYRPYDSSLTQTYIRFLTAAAPLEYAYLTLLKLVEPPVRKHLWNAAVDTVLKYKHLFPGDRRLDSLVSVLKTPQENLQVKPLPGQVNTPDADEFLPVISMDDKTLYFCAKGRKDNLGLEDIFYSKKENGKWAEPVPENELNTATGNEAVLSVSADGNSLIIFKNANIYVTHKTKYGWSIPEEIPEINSQYWDADAYITADGNAILFSSDRPNPSGAYHPFGKPYHGNFDGNLDIWVVIKTKNGWSKPINLGPVINTPYAERSPMLHPDMKTLYFISDGHTTLGGMDILVSHRLSDTSWTQWSEPVNLGRKINTPDDEFGYNISTKGDLAYFSKIIDSHYDIYTVQMPENARPMEVIRISGTVTDNNGKPLHAKIVWEDLEKNKKLGELYTDPSTGKYVIPLPTGKYYGFYVTSKGYYPLSSSVDLRKTKDTSDLKKDFVLYSIREIIDNQQAIVLNNVFFDFNSANLRPESYPELDRLCRFIKAHPDLKIEISGHTDNVGSQQYNKALSLKRAEAVRNYLESKGCNPENLVVVGYGASKPVAENTTEEGRQQNRRVEFRIIGKNN